MSMIYFSCLSATRRSPGPNDLEHLPLPVDLIDFRELDQLRNEVINCPEQNYVLFGDGQNCFSLLSFYLLQNFSTSDVEFKFKLCGFRQRIKRFREKPDVVHHSASGIFTDEQRRNEISIEEITLINPLWFNERVYEVSLHQPASTIKHLLLLRCQRLGLFQTFRIVLKGILDLLPRGLKVGKRRYQQSINPQHITTHSKLHKLAVTTIVFIFSFTILRQSLLVPFLCSLIGGFHSDDGPPCCKNSKKTANQRLKVKQYIAPSIAASLVFHDPWLAKNNRGHDGCKDHRDDHKFKERILFYHHQFQSVYPRYICVHAIRVVQQEVFCS